MRFPILPPVVGFFCLAFSLFAQEPPKPEVPPPPPPAPVVAPATPAPAPEPLPRTVTRERSIYIPFEKLEQVFEKQERGVFLPYREFLEMWNRLNLPENLKPLPPPVEGVLSSASYVGRVEGEVATLKAQMNFEALKEGWSKLALGAADLAVTEAKSKAILSTGKEGYEILFPEKGTYPLEATIFGKITKAAGKSTLAITLPATAASQFELTIPEKGLDFTLEPEAAYAAKENPDGSTRLLVYFGGATKIALSWTRRVSETAQKPLLYVEAKTELRLSPGAVRTEAELDYRILRAGVTALEVQVPGDQQVLSVEGENIREWSVAGQRLHVTLHTAVRDEYTLQISLERALPPLPQAVPFPMIKAEGVERQTGTVALFTDPELTTQVSDLQELTQQATSPKADDEEQIPQGEYRYLHLPYAGKVTVAEAKPQVEIASQTLVTVKPDRTEVYVQMDGRVKRAGIFGVEIELPPGFEHFEATGEGVESSTVTGGNAPVLQVKFTERKLDAFTFFITGEARREKPESPLTVPVFRPNVERHDARVGVAIHPSLKANTTDRGGLREEDVRGLLTLAQPEKMPQAAAHASLVPGLEPAPRNQAEELTLGFRYRGAAKPAQISFELRKPRVSAEVEALLEVRETVLRHTWHLAYNIEFAGIDELQFSVPAAIADEVQITGADIKERTRTQPAAADGTPGPVVIWRVTLQAKVLGPYLLLVSYEAPRGEQKPGQTVPVVWPELTVLNVSRETGQVAVVKDGNIEITKNEAKGLELIDPKELGLSLRQDGIFLAWKYAAHPLELKLEISKNFFLEVPAAIVSYAVLGSVVSEDEAETTEVIYWVRNNGLQFFSVQLPGSDASAARLLSDAFVDGEPQQPSRRPERNELLIRLPAITENRSFPIRFVYERPSVHPGKKLGWRGTLHLEPPLVSGVHALQSLWTVYLPAEQRYVSFTSAMREPVGVRGWGLLRSGLDLFVPELGPIPPGPGSIAQAEPPALPAAKKTGFDTQLQREGVPVTLRRLGDPAPVAIGYRSQAYAATVEAVAFLLSLSGGLLLLGSSRRVRFFYFLVFGLGALVVAGARDPRAAGVWQAIYLGTFAAVVVWLLVGMGRGVLRLGRRPATSAPKAK